MTPAQLGPSPTWPGIPDTPTPCTRISCGAGSAGAKEMVSTRWSGSSEHTHRALRPALGTAWPHALLDQHVDARRYEGSSSSAQNITVHHGALAYLLVINALRASEAAAVRIEDLSLIHISEPTRRTPISYAVFCLKKKKKQKNTTKTQQKN